MTKQEMLKTIYDFDEEHYIISGGANTKNIETLVDIIIEETFKEYRKQKYTQEQMDCNYIKGYYKAMNTYRNDKKEKCMSCEADIEKNQGLLF